MLRKNWKYADAELSKMLEDTIDQTGTITDVASHMLQRVGQEVDQRSNLTIPQALETALEDVTTAYDGDVAQRVDKVARIALFRCNGTWAWRVGADGVNVALEASNRLLAEGLDWDLR